MNDANVRPRGRFDGLRIRRTRGALSGFLLILLGVWGAVIPFVGPLFHFAYTPDRAWAWTAARGWLEVLPGVVTVIGGLLLLGSANRVTAMIGGWLTVLAGSWFVLGDTFSRVLRTGSAGNPMASTDAKWVLLEVAYFYGVGLAIVFLGGVALGSLSIVSVRDMANTPGAVSPDEVTEVMPPPPAGPKPGKRGLFRRRRTDVPAAR